MTYSITITGATPEELRNNVLNYIGEVAAEKSVPAPFEAPKKPSNNTQKEQAVSTATTSQEGTEFDGVQYGATSTQRNVWILLTDGRVLFVPAGGRLPLDSERAKNITKKEYTEIEEDEPERVVTAIGEVIEDRAKNVDRKEPTPEPDPAADIEPEADDDEDDDEASDDEVSELIEKAEGIAKKIKRLDGGKKAIKDLLSDYDVRRISKFEDTDDLVDFIDDLKEALEDLEDAE